MSLTIRQIIGISMLIYNMQLRIAKENTMLIILPSVEINILFRYSLIISCRIIARLHHLKDKFHIIFLYSSLHLIFPHNKDIQMKRKLSRNRLTASGNRKLFNLLLLNWLNSLRMMFLLSSGNLIQRINIKILHIRGSINKTVLQLPPLVTFLTIL